MSGNIYQMSTTNFININSAKKFSFGTIILEGVLQEYAVYLEGQAPTTFTEGFLWSEVGLKFTKAKNVGCSEEILAKWIKGNKLAISQFFFDSPPYPFHAGPGDTVYFEEIGTLGKKFLQQYKLSKENYYQEIIKAVKISFKMLHTYGEHQGVEIPEEVDTKEKLLDLFEQKFVLPSSPAIKGWKKNGFLSRKVFVDQEGRPVHEVEQICDSGSEGEISRLGKLPSMIWGEAEVNKWLSLWNTTSPFTTLLEYVGYHTCKFEIIALHFYFFLRFTLGFG